MGLYPPIHSFKSFSHNLEVCEEQSQQEQFYQITIYDDRHDDNTGSNDVNQDERGMHLRRIKVISSKKQSREESYEKIKSLASQNPKKQGDNSRMI